MEKELRACPLCGDPMMIDNSDTLRHASADHCLIGKQGWHADARNIAAWNTRTTPDELTSDDPARGAMALTRDETCPMCEGKKMGPGEFCIAGCRDGVVRWTAANVLRNVKPWLECPRSPDGKHQVDTSMESGPNNCFHCEQPMRAIRKLGEG